MDFHLVERIGGQSRFVTLLSFLIHFLHSLFCVVNFLSWVRTPACPLSRSIKEAYLSLTVVCCVFYFLGTSVFYMWAWRFPEPEEIAKRRRIYGVAVHLFFCDIPIFVLETRIVWLVRFPVAIMGFNYCLTCVSICYSVLRVWLFLMVRIIKFRVPTAPAWGLNYPTWATATRRRDTDLVDYSAGLTDLYGDGDGDDYNDGFTASPTTFAGNNLPLNANTGVYHGEGAMGEGNPRASPAEQDNDERYGAPSWNRMYAPPANRMHSAPAQGNNERRNVLYDDEEGAATFSPHSPAPPFRI